MLKVFDKANTTFQGPKHIFSRYAELNASSVLGGEETLDVTIPYAALPANLSTEDFVEYEGKSYIIKRFSSARTEAGKMLTMQCSGLYELLIDTIIQGSDTWLAGVTFQAALTRALRGTLFSVGRCDDFGTWDIELGEMNVLEAINAMKTSWPVTPEIYFDGFTLNAVTTRGTRTNVQIAYKKNLGAIDKVEDSSNQVTRLKGRGAEGLTIEGLDVTDISDLTGFSWELKNGRKIITKDYVDAPNIAQYAIPKEAIKEWSELTKPLDLFKKMQEYILQVYKPEISYTATFMELSKQGVPFGDVHIGDWVWVNDADTGIQENVRVVELSQSPISASESTATFATRQSTIIDFLAELQDTKNLIGGVAGGLAGKFDELENAIREATKIINAGNSTVIISENDGIIVIDSTTLGPGGVITNATKLIKMANGAIGCSTDGGTSFRTAMTADGINADLITAGRVAASFVSVGSMSGFEAGFHPDDVRDVVYTEMDNTKHSVLQRADANDGDISVLNTSLQETNTVMTMLEQELRDSVDILNQDVSGLSGNQENLNHLYNAINTLIRADSYFYWDESGIHAIEYSNPQHQMLLTSTGLGLSRDGGRSFENAITAQGIMASQVNIGQFSEEPFKGLIIHNGIGEETFAVDTNGNISLTGNINMVGGSIAWHAVSKMPYEALDDDFQRKFTYIDSEGIYTKIVEADQINVHGLEVLDNKGETTFAITSTGDVTVRGNIHMKAGSTIEWESVNAPTAEQVGAPTDSEYAAHRDDMLNRTTKITSNGIYTGTVDAAQITVGKIKITQLDSSSVTPASLGAATAAQFTVLENKVTSVQSSLSTQISNVQSNSNALISGMNSQIDFVKANYISNSNLTPTVTSITEHAISTATLRGDQIYGGTITGVTLAGVVLYADDRIYVGRQGVSTDNAINSRREIIFDDVGIRSYIRYERRGDNSMNLIVHSDNKLLLFGQTGIKYHNRPQDLKFAKRGLSTDGAASDYFSLQDILNALDRLGEKIV